jgi:hypothetical protein
MNFVPGFAIVGKGIAKEIRRIDGTWSRTTKGLKLIYGYILPDGTLTLESSNVVGSGDEDAMNTLDAAPVNQGIITAHQTKDDDFQLIYWKFHNLLYK